MKLLPKLIGLLTLSLTISVLPSAARPASARIAIFTAAVRTYVPPVDREPSQLPETFVLVDGGYAPGTARDGKLVKLSWTDLSAPLSDTLIAKGFTPCAEGAVPNLYLMVEWGRTKPYQDLNIDLSMNAIGEMSRAAPETTAFGEPRPNRTPSGVADSESRQNSLRAEREKIGLGAEQQHNSTWDNALLLGYADELARIADLPRASRPWKRRDELMNDLTSERLYLIIRAFAAPPEAETPAPLLWLARISIRDQGPDFPTQLETMLPFAARYFGRSTHELIRATSIKDLKSR